MSLKSALFSHLKGAYNLATTVVAGTDVFTATAHGRINGDKVWLTTSSILPDPLAVETNYFIINKTTNTFKLSLTSGGAAIDITDTGTGTHKLATALSNQVADRIYATRAEKNATTPYIVYRDISTVRFPHIGAPSGMVRTRIQFDIYDPSPLTVLNAVEALRLMLDGYDKAMGAELLDVRLCHFEDANDGFIDPFMGDEIGLAVTSVDFFITYAESIPLH
jgi:hypothetical protein